VPSSERTSVSTARRRAAPLIEICPATTFDDKSSKAAVKNNATEKKVYHFNDIVYH
jgi:hypothetical protein